MNRTHMDWTFFIVAFFLLIGLCTVIFLFPDSLYVWFEQVRIRINDGMGILFLWVGTCSLLFLIWVAFGRYGKIKLGDHRSEPEHSTGSWIAMIFCAGIGSGVMYWGTIEWAYHYIEPPLGLKAYTPEAIEWSVAYGLFHHGPTAWAIYVIPALPAAYLFHVKKQPILKISEACRPILGKASDGVVGKLLDLFFVVGLLGASGTSLGISVPMMASGLSHLTGLPNNFGTQLIMLLFCTAVFSASVYSGLGKGIKRLSQWNMYIIALLLGAIFFLGPTVFIMELSTNSVGLIADQFFRLNTWIDPIEQSGFPEKWTIFYWAWWIVYAPFVGLFIAKVSKGRSIQQMILGTLLFGPLGCWLFFFVCGNYGLFMQLTNKLDVIPTILSNKPYEAIMTIIGSLPQGSWFIALFTILAILFVATTYDSSSYMIAAVTQRKLEKEEPYRWNRLFWAFALAVPPAALLFIGGLNTLQAVTILIAIPSSLMIILLGMSFLKMVR